MSYLTVLDANDSDLVAFRLTKSLVSNGSYMPVISSPKFDDIVHGRLFIVSEIVSVPSDSNYTIGIVTDSENVAIIPIVSVLDTTEIAAYENSTFTGGDTVAIHKRNLTSTNTCKTKVYSSPTITDSGNRVLNYLVPGGKFSGSTSTFDESWIIPANSKFLFEIDNKGNSASDVGVILEIVELI